MESTPVNKKMDKNEKIRERFADIIENIKEIEGISRAEIARSIDVNAATFGKILDGSTQTISNTILHRLKKAYGVNGTRILTGIGEKFLPPHERIEEIAEKPAAYGMEPMSDNSLLETMRQALQRFMELNINQETEILELRDRLKKLDQDEKATEKSG